MSKILPSQIAVAARGAQAQAQRLANQSAGIYDQVGRFNVVLDGVESNGLVTTEAITTVTFTNAFTLRPTPLFGYELDENQNMPSGAFLSASTVVIRWITSGPTMLPTYTGAMLGTCLNGPKGMSVWVDFFFTGAGLAFPAPISPTNGTGSA